MSFTLPILLIAIIIEILLRQIPSDYLLKKKYLDAHSKEIETLILGSSHSYYGINPIYFSTNTFNVSHLSQSLDYDFEILKKYQNDFKSLKTVICPISYFTLYTKLESSTESWRIKNYVIYYDIDVSNSLSDHLEVLSNRFSLNLRRLGSYYIKGDSSISCTELGWGTGNKSEKARDLKETGPKAAIRHTGNLEAYEENKETLRSIIELCESHGISVILVTLPAYETYRQNLNPEQLKVTVETAADLANEYNNCQYLNLLESTEFDAKDFYDADHLNEIGAEKLSLLINKVVDKAESANPLIR